MKYGVNMFEMQHDVHQGNYKRVTEAAGSSCIRTMVAFDILQAYSHKCNMGKKHDKKNEKHIQSMCDITFIIVFDSVRILVVFEFALLN